LVALRGGAVGGGLCIAVIGRAEKWALPVVTPECRCLVVFCCDWPRKKVGEASQSANLFT